MSQPTTLPTTLTTPGTTHSPLRVMFLLTSMPVGGAEMLLVNLIRRLDRERFLPEVCCLKEPGPLGVELAKTIPVHSQLTRGKFDVTVLGRLTNLMNERAIDAAITVGCGDKMFWGRLAARRARVPVIASALHSTGWPDGVGRLNRLLTNITDAFIGVAQSHGQHLVHGEGFPKEKVHVIPNGVDTDRFCPAEDRVTLRRGLELPEHGSIATIVAALRPEKNHRRFLDAARIVSTNFDNAHFVIVGDGPERAALESYADNLALGTVHFLGSRPDIPEILQASDVFMLTSDNEAAPVSILEAMACELPTIASDVGSIHEMVLEGQTGFLVPRDASAFAQRLLELFRDDLVAQQMGIAGRKYVVANSSLQVMVDGYQDLIESIYRKKSREASPYLTGSFKYQPQDDSQTIPTARQPDA